MQVNHGLPTLVGALRKSMKVFGLMEWPLRRELALTHSCGCQGSMPTSLSTCTSTAQHKHMQGRHFAQGLGRGARDWRCSAPSFCRRGAEGRATGCWRCACTAALGSGALRTRLSARVAFLSRLDID